MHRVAVAVLGGNVDGADDVIIRVGEVGVIGGVVGVGVEAEEVNVTGLDGGKVGLQHWGRGTPDAGDVFCVGGGD